MEENRPRPYDPVIVGGGIIGLMLALRLRGRGLDPLVLEKSAHPGHAATWASAGMLAPQGEASAPGPGFELAARGRDLYPALAAQLRRDTGIDIELRLEGSLHLAFDGEEENRLRSLYEWQLEAGLEVIELSDQEIWIKEPTVSKEVTRGFFLPDDIQLNPRRLVDALLASLESSGVEVHAEEEVLALETEDGSVSAVVTAGGRYETGRVVYCPGAWAGLRVEGFPRAVVRPIRGQIVMLRTQNGPPISCCVHGHGVYIVPRNDGTTIVGATMEDVGFECEVTEGAIEDLRRRGSAVVPALARGVMREATAGLRPDTPDHLPLLGTLGPDGLFLATGHFRQGIATAPSTAELLASWLVSGRKPTEVEAFDPGRFGTEREST